jgi:hypothetical protein
VGGELKLFRDPRPKDQRQRDTVRWRLFALPIAKSRLKTVRKIGKLVVDELNVSHRVCPLKDIYVDLRWMGKIASSLGSLVNNAL